MSSTEHSNGQYCPQCDNHCPADALRCGKGRHYFGLEESGHGHGAPDGSLAGLLQQCGRFIHHGGHGTEEENQLFQALTEEERAALRILLEKLSDGWRQQFGADCLGHGHHGHGGGERQHGYEGHGR